MVAGGHGICNLMYVDNLLRGLEAVIAHPAPPAGFYHVGDDETTTWREYYAALAAGLGVDAATAHEVPGDRFHPTLRDRLEIVPEWRAYKWLKQRLRDETRKAIKFRLGRLLHGNGGANGGPAGPSVTRELWHLQMTRHRLPTAKFRATFGATNTDTFASAMATSLAWLRFVGFVGEEAPRRSRTSPAAAAVPVGSGPPR
jgi:hypothetical protein